MQQRQTNKNYKFLEITQKITTYNLSRSQSQIMHMFVATKNTYAQHSIRRSAHVTSGRGQRADCNIKCNNNEHNKIKTFARKQENR